MNILSCLTQLIKYERCDSHASTVVKLRTVPLLYPEKYLEYNQYLQVITSHKRINPPNCLIQKNMEYSLIKALTLFLTFRPISFEERTKIKTRYYCNTPRNAFIQMEDILNINSYISNLHTYYQIWHTTTKEPLKISTKLLVYRMCHFHDYQPHI